MKKILLIGGEEGINVVEFIEEISEYEILGFLNDREEAGTIIGKYPVLAKTSEWNKFNDCYFVFTIFRYFGMLERFSLLKNLCIPLDRFPTIIHPLAYVAKTSNIGKGVVVYPFAKIHSYAEIGNFCSIRSGANIGHGSLLGEFNYIGPNAVLSGHVKTEEGVYIAPNATINPWLELGKYSMVGSNSTIYKNVDEFKILQCMPARVLGRTDEQLISH